MLRRLAFLAAFVAFASTGVAAKAAIISIGQSAFSGSETVIDFEGQGFNNGDAITNQYAGSGVTFSGDFLADTFSTTLLPPSSDSVAAGNLSHFPRSSATIDFTVTQNRLGFDAITVLSNDLELKLQTSDGGGGFTTTGTVDFTTGLSSSFVGVEDLLSGFDRVVLSAVGSFGGFALDNLRFEHAAKVQDGEIAVPIVGHMPVPAALPLLMTALASLGFAGWRRKRQAG